MEKVEVKDKLRIKGHVTATVRDAETGEILEVIHGKNLVTDVGEELFMKWMNDEAANIITYCAVGTDNTPAAEADVTLGAEIGRILITDQTRVTTTITYSTFFASGDCNGAWEEEGLLNAAAAGTLVTHTLFAATVNKDATKTVTVDHTLTMAGA